MPDKSCHALAIEPVEGKSSMQSLHTSIKTSFLILLCSTAASPVCAQKTDRAKSKIASAPFQRTAPPPPVVLKKLPATVKTKSARLVKSSYPSSHFEKGCYFKQQGKLNEALVEFIRATQENPRNLKAFQEQANIFKQQGRIKLAKSALEQALSVSPDNSQMRSFLVQLHFESGNLLGAASEVGKLFNFNKPQPPKEKTTAQDLKELNAASGTMTIIDGDGVKDGKKTESEPADETSAWLSSAAGKAVNQTAREIDPPARGFNEILAGIPALKDASGKEIQSQAGAVTAEAKEGSAETRSSAILKSSGHGNNGHGKNAAGAPEAVSEILSKIPGQVFEGKGSEQPDSAEKAEASKNLKALAEAKATAESLAAPAQKQEAFWSMARVRSNTNRMVQGLKNPIPGWLKDRLPDAQNKEDSKGKQNNENRSSVLTWVRDKLPFNSDEKAESPDKGEPSKAASMLSYLKDRMSLAGHGSEPAPKAPVSPVDAYMKAANQKSLTRNLMGRMNLPQILKKDKSGLGALAAAGNTTTSTTTTSTTTTSYQPVTPNNLPPEIAKHLEGKFNGPVNLSAQAPGEKKKEPVRQRIDPQIEQVLSSIPKALVNGESKRPALPGPVYGLLNNNALTHLAASSPRIHRDELDSDEPGLLGNLISQAGKTFSKFVPAISLKLPVVPGFKRETPESVVAAVPPPDPQAQDLQAQVGTGDSVPVPVPLDVKRILGNFGNNKPKPAKAPLLPTLSASIPLAAAPAAVQSMIPMPQMPLSIAQTPECQGTAPVIAPSGLQRSVIAPTGPQSTPRSSSVPMQPLIANLPPIVQTAMSQAEPIVRPAIDLARDFVNTVAPLNIPKSESQAATPVQSSAQVPIANDVPVPVAASNQYFRDILPHSNLPSPDAQQSKETSSSTPGDAQTNSQTLPVGNTLTAMQPVMAALPPPLQSAISQAEPLIKPAIDAAKNMVQNMAPDLVQQSSPIPLQVQVAMGNVPVPVGVDTQKYYKNVPQKAAVQNSSGSSLKIIQVQKDKAGAFTFMKPLIDGDGSYLRDRKQVRTIEIPQKKIVKEEVPEEDEVTKRMRYLLAHGTSNLRRGEAFMFSESTGEGTLFLPDGSCQRRQLEAPQDADKVLRARRPDIVSPKDLQYSLNLLGKLLPAQQQNNQQQNNNAVNGPSLEQLLNQMDQQKKGFFGWMKKSFGIQ